MRRQGHKTSRRSGRRERDARARWRRRVVFVVVAAGLLVGVQTLVDVLTRPDWDDTSGKAAAFAPPVIDGGSGGDMPSAGPDVSAAAGAAGAASSQIPRGLNPQMRSKAVQMQKRYSDRLSKMSAKDKMRALNKASKLLGRDVSGMAGR